jgi:hypothetical protein
MTDLEGRLKALLEERSRDYLVEPDLPRGVATRSRRRRALVGTGAGLGALAAIVLGAAALRAIAPPETGTEPSPTLSPPPVETWRGIWPQSAREEAEAAQASADADDPKAIWQLNVVKVVHRYARSELGFTRVYFDGTVTIDEQFSPGPHAIHVSSCEPRDLAEWPPVCGPGWTGMYSEITVERLLRADRSGIWFVTEAVPATPVDAEPVGSPEPVAVYPDTFVGITNDGDLVLASVADGSVIRMLLDRERFDLELRSSAFSPDGSSVYVTERSGTNTPRILSVPLDGGEPVVVARGFAPAISEDGRLAFSACGQDGCGTELEVELPGGTSTRFDVSRFVEEGVGAIAWLPDGRLVVSIFYPGDSGPDLRVVDPASPPDHLLDLPTIGRRRVGDAWFVLGYHAPTSGVALQYYCCSTYAADPIEVQQVLSIDPDTGEYGPSLVEDAPFGVSLDRTGRFFLLPQKSEDGTGKGLFLLEQDGRLRRIAEGYVEVAW